MKTNLGIFSLLAGAAFLAYFTALGGVFQFDDYNVIVFNPAVHSFAAWLSAVPHGIRPLLKFTYMLNWTSGWGVFGFHLFNVAVHASNTVLIYLLTRKFFDRRPENSPDSAFFGLITALLFALHPIQSEAVAYISGRSMSLMALFYLAAMLAYVIGAESGRRTLLFIVSPLLFAAAVAVKETAVTLPFALVLWEASAGNAKNRRDASRRQAAHWGILFCLALFFVLDPAYFALLSYGFESRGTRTNLLSQINGVCYLLSHLVFPLGQNIDPALPVLSSWTLLLAAKALFLSALLVAGIVSFRRRPWLGFGLLWFFLHVLPTNSIIPRLDIANERHLYLAGWGIFLAVGGELMRLHNREVVKPGALKGAVAGLLLVLMLVTAMRNRVYRSEISLWEDAAGKNPENARAHNNLGFAYFDAGRGRDALAEYQEALRLRPGYARAKENIASLKHTLARERVHHAEQE